MGLQVCITLRRNGFRIKHRAIKRREIPKKIRIRRGESIDFMKKLFNLNIGEENDVQRS